jgi:hypothetical protein
MKNGEGSITKAESRKQKAEKEAPERFLGPSAFLFSAFCFLLSAFS